MAFWNKEKKLDPKKAASLEAKGDQLAEKEKFQKAMKAYRGAQEANPENPAIYEKLVETQMHLKEDWDEKEFFESMTWTMKKQELENPGLSEVYETLGPEYREIQSIITQMLVTEPEAREPLIQKIKGFGIKALRPLLDTLLSIDAMARGIVPSQPSDMGTVPPPPSEEDPPGGKN